MKDDSLESRLVAVARQALRHAYAPYSHYSVGAAVADPEGRIFPGCNVENASYGLTICAERVAIGAAIATGVRRLAAVAVAAEKSVPYPCGACRQVMAEFMDGNAPILVAGPDGAPQRFSLDDLLPCRFANFPLA